MANFTNGSVAQRCLDWSQQFRQDDPSRSRCCLTPARPPDAGALMTARPCPIGMMKRSGAGYRWGHRWFHVSGKGTRSMLWTRPVSSISWARSRARCPLLTRRWSWSTLLLAWRSAPNWGGAMPTSESCPVRSSSTRWIVRTLTLNACSGIFERSFDRAIVAAQLPVGEGSEFRGVVDLVTMKAYLGEAGTEADVPADLSTWPTKCARNWSRRRLRAMMS